MSHHVSVSTLSGDDLLRKFWEVEELHGDHLSLAPEENSVLQHFHDTHYRDEEGRFVVPLPRKVDVNPLGESRSLAVRRFLTLERSLRSKNCFEDFSAIIEEYFEMGHAEPVPLSDLELPCNRVFYLPMHAVVKESSSTTKIRAVFDTSAKSSLNVSLNDLLLVGPTVHSSLVDVLIRFQQHRIALTTDVSRMYRAVLLPAEERDLHRFVWRKNVDAPLIDYRMTCVTFGVASSSFAANMAVKQNALDGEQKFPLAAAAVRDSFYVDDGLTGADSPQEAIELQEQLQEQLHELFASGGFLLRKWRSSSPAVLQHIPLELQDRQPSQSIPDADSYVKTLGLEWNSSQDLFCLTVSELQQPLKIVTKQALISDVAKIFDALGWFAPSMIKMKIMLQTLWESKVGWDDPVADEVRESWEKWRSELTLLSGVSIPHCYFRKDVQVASVQLHGSVTPLSQPMLVSFMFGCWIHSIGLMSLW